MEGGRSDGEVGGVMEGRNDRGVMEGRCDRGVMERWEK